MPRKIPDESTNHPDGIREGMMSDQAGVQFGVKMDPDVTINPAHIAKVKKQASKNQKNKKE